MDRTQPSLPMVLGRAATITHDYKRNGTTDLFAAMSIATGEVLTHCQKGHTAKDVLRFFKQIHASIPRGLAVQVVLDNLRRTRALRSPSGWATATADAGTCTSPRHRGPGRISRSESSKR